ncbi:hypothetical protein WJX72_001411 [[Myrmecia] bisecta]|uniref:RING-type E3 ubiquitin transferase n=1 Tax=[Myrmecia] bisecta TaxID=41462 RepID=A0AAW1PMR9_9CHLO
MTDKVLCRYYMHGACRNGASCRFSHDIKAMPNMVCTYYLAGNCGFGDHCRYDHIRPDYTKPEHKQPPRPPSQPAVQGGLLVIRDPFDDSLTTVERTFGSACALDDSPAEPDSWEQSEGPPCPATPDSLAERPLCSQHASFGHCSRGDRCSLVHGDECEICHKYCIHPYSQEERDRHLTECRTRHERLAARTRSSQIECGICLEPVLSKANSAHRKFGLLNCDHAYCLPCIRGWRSNTDSGADVNSAVRTCPICRTTAWFVTPCTVWPANAEEREHIVAGYKSKLAQIDCRHFNFGDNTCPFGTSCFYRHVYRDGTPQETVLRKTSTSEGNCKIVQPVSLAAPQTHGPPLGPYKLAKKSHPTAAQLGEEPLISQCDLKYHETTLDHFSWATPPRNRQTFQQRYFVCDQHWKQNDDGSKGPIFFYVGNEADVTLYLNATGLMWESAPDFGALLVWAEHRYYGKSKPFQKTLQEHMQFLTSEQAMADYAELVTDLKRELHAEHSPVIGFGGSYGGMLASWMRLKYPHILDGAIAGSAPIWSFFGEDPPYDAGSFSKIVTRDASPAAGAPAACVANVRQSWQTLFGLGKDEEGRQTIRKAMNICHDAKLDGPEDVEALANWASGAFDYLAMGNFPYESSYILNGQGTLPPYPMRAACQPMAQPGLEGPELLTALAKSIGVFYNYSGVEPCFSWDHGANPDTDEDALFWGYQWCTEMVQPFTRDGVQDMYWEQKFDMKAASAACQAAWGVRPRPMWPTIAWGGKRIQTLSNVVFTNGLLDPWHGGGVLTNISDSVVSILIPEGAHHLDLMFSHPKDPPSVTQCRNAQRQHMRRWVEEADKARAQDRTKMAAEESLITAKS